MEVGWMDENWKRESSVCPPRVLTRFQSSICVHDVLDPRLFGQCCAAESLHECWGSYEDRAAALLSDVHRASPPWVPVGQSEHSCPEEQQLDLCPDQSVCCRYCKRTPQALFSGRSLRWGTRTVEAWGCLGLQLFSPGLYLLILNIWKNFQVWLHTAELSLHLNAVCDVTDIILTLIPGKRSMCPSLIWPLVGQYCVTKEAELTPWLSSCMFIIIYESRGVSDAVVGAHEMTQID